MISYTLEYERQFTKHLSQLTRRQSESNDKPCFIILILSSFIYLDINIECGEASFRFLYEK